MSAGAKRRSETRDAQGRERGVGAEGRARESEEQSAGERGERAGGTQAAGKHGELKRGKIVPRQPPRQQLSPKRGVRGC